MKYEITKEQLQELAKGNAKVERWFPEAFEAKLEAGKWYKSESLLGVYNADKLTYGFFEGKFGNEWLMTDNGFYTPATESEVFEALKKEAVKRGFVAGAIVKCPDYFGNGIYNKRNVLKSSSFLSYELWGDLRMDRACESGSAYVIFKDGKWAEIIKEKTLSKSEAEAMINQFKNDDYTYKIG